MAEQGGGANERVSIRQSAKFHKKYGSTTTNHMKARSSDSFVVKHTVSQTDTLQGIALKYGVTMEQIRRTNKIWANQDVFLRKTLDIPVAKTSLDTISWEETNGSGNDDGGIVPPSSSSSSRRDSSRAAMAGEVNMNGPQQLQRRNSAPDASGLLPSDPTIADILIRIDSSIALTRSQVERREKLQEFTSEDGLHSPRRTSQHHLHHHHQSRVRQSMTRNRLSDFDDLNATTTIQPAGSMTQGRKVESSLQRLQREQDEMFEL